MRVTVVPAQVTTVEDRIIGSLGFTQILLLVVPVFTSAGIFALAPPFMGIATYKYALMATTTLIFCLLAIRIKGKIVASWLATILRYNLRPKYYLFNKNTMALREDYPVRNTSKTTNTVKASSPKKAANYHIEIDPLSATRILAAIENPTADIRFETDRKGGLHVRFSEVEE